MATTNNRRPRILLGITGSIAAVKGPRLALLLAHNLKARVEVVLTRTVEQYFWKRGGVARGYDAEAWEEFWAAVKKCKNGLDVSMEEDDLDVSMEEDVDDDVDWRLTNGSISIHYAQEEWDSYKDLSSPVLHIQLRAWADILLIAPLSAHTLGKIANGLCDDLLSCIVRAWDFGQRDGSNGKPVILCPAMNTAMWDHVLTGRQLDVVKGFGMSSASCSNGSLDSIVVVVEPMVKKLACGDVGAGALAEVEDIVACVQKCLSSNHGNLPLNDSSKSSDTHQQTFIHRKNGIKKALLRYSKQKFSEMKQSSSCLAAPISPTPNDIITLFLPYLNLGPDSLLVDLGCGDGRWLITAAKLTKCKCLGIDVDDQRLELANRSIEEEGLTNQVDVIKQDVFEFLLNYDLATIDVLVIYLFRDAMLKVGTLLRQRSSYLKQGVKILCVGFALPQWKAIRIEIHHGMKVYLYENTT